MQHSSFMDEPAMTEWAARLADHLDGGLVIYLRGDLGVGKTTFARALLRALGVQERIKSPTYSVVESYPLADGEAHHLDLYRIADAEEIHWLGVDELLDSNALVLVEWPQKGVGMLPAADLTVYLRHAGEEREVAVSATSARGQALLSRM